MNFFADNLRNINFVSGDLQNGSLRTLFSQYRWRINEPDSDVSISWEFLGMELGTWSYSRRMLQKPENNNDN